MNNKTKKGSIGVNGKGETFEVLGRKNGGTIIVKFVETGHIKEVSSANVIRGQFQDDSKSDARKPYEIGDTIENIKGQKVKIINEEQRVQPSGKKVKYHEVEFLETGFRTFCTIDNFKRGKIKDLYLPTVHGHGIIGDVPEGTKFRGNPIYSVWAGIIARCHDDLVKSKNKAYKDVTVSERWIYFSNFLEDVEKIPNYELWKEHWSDRKNPYELDKDILSKDSKVYSLETCMFVHKKWNAGYNSQVSKEEKKRIREEVLNDLNSRK